MKHADGSVHSREEIQMHLLLSKTTRIRNASQSGGGGDYSRSASQQGASPEEEGILQGFTLPDKNNQ